MHGVDSRTKAVERPQLARGSAAYEGRVHGDHLGGRGIESQIANRYVRRDTLPSC